MKHILLLGALFLFGATASAQSCTGAGGDKAKTECTKGKSSSCCQGKATTGSSCCSGKSSSTDKKDKKKAKGKEQGKSNESLARVEEKAEGAEKNAKVGPAKGSDN